MFPISNDELPVPVIGAVDLDHVADGQKIGSECRRKRNGRDIHTGRAMNISHSVPSTVASASFSFLSTEDIRRISVKQSANPTLLDDLNRPNIGGLYDPALGPSDPRDMYVGWENLTCISTELHIQMQNMSPNLLHLPGALWTHRASLTSLPSIVYGEDIQPPTCYMSLLS